MTKIKNYDLDIVLQADDKWIGTDANGNRTVNYSLSRVAQYIIDVIDSGGDPDLSPRILVTARTAGAVINGEGVADDNIAKAVNRSFKGMIEVSENEILVMRAQRQVLISGQGTYGVAILDEQYYWNKGAAVINGNSTIDDWDLDYSIEVARNVFTNDLSQDPKTRPLAASDTSDPATALNANPSILSVSPSTGRENFIVFSTSTEKDYKIYDFTGPDGSYGQGSGNTATAGMFTEIPLQEETAKTRLSEFIDDVGVNLRPVTIFTATGNIGEEVEIAEVGPSVVTGIELTLPAASDVPNGKQITVKSNGGKHLVSLDGSDTIDYDTGGEIISRFSAITLVSDGVSNWTLSSSVSTDGLVTTVKRVFTDAELKAASDLSPLAFGDAPGVGKIQHPISIVCKTDPGGVLFDDNDLNIGLVGDINQEFGQCTILDENTVSIESIELVGNWPAIENAQFAIFDTSPPTVGDGTLTVWVHYIISDFS